MELLPIEIKKYILLFLDDKNAREARLVCVDWFKWIKYSKFTIPFANQHLLEQITQRLSTYSWLVELKINRAIDLTCGCLIRNISHLTQLKSVQINGFTNPINTSPSDWLNLSVLTNLETWDCIAASNDFLRQFTNLKYVPGLHWYQLNGMQTNLECIAAFSQDLPALPLSLTKLTAVIRDNQAKIDSLTRLTRLKRLEIQSTGAYIIDAKDMTGLETLTTYSMNINGLEQCTRLTELSINSPTYNKNTMSYASALKRLNTLTLTLPRNSDLSLPDLPHMTSLSLICNSVVLSSLPMSLRYLRLELEDSHDYSNMSHLTLLTSLSIWDSSTIDPELIEPISNLTQLMSLTLYREEPVLISFTNLQHLTHLSLTRVELDELTLHYLTELQRLIIWHSPFTQEHWQSLERLNKLTSLRIIRPTDCVKRVNYTTIAHLPLRELGVDIPEIENFWSVVAKLTDLDKLEVPRLESSEQLLALVPLKLTELVIKRKSNEATEEYLTCLTSLQHVNLRFKMSLSSDDLKQKLTRLYSLIQIK